MNISQLLSTLADVVTIALAVIGGVHVVIKALHNLASILYDVALKTPTKDDDAVIGAVSAALSRAAVWSDRLAELLKSIPVIRPAK